MDYRPLVPRIFIWPSDDQDQVLHFDPFHRRRSGRIFRRPPIRRRCVRPLFILGRRIFCIRILPLFLWL